MIIIDKEYLKQPCKDATLFDAQDIINKLELVLNESKIKGVGLAANQIGINSKVCIIRLGQEKLNLVNPIIIEKYDIMVFKDESCLSFPGEAVITKRFNEIVVKDLFHPAGIVLIGLEAVVGQHEIGHLNGETMHDYIIQIPDGPNAVCWCSSGKKYKKCHMDKFIKQSF